MLQNLLLWKVAALLVRTSVKTKVAKGGLILLAVEAVFRFASITHTPLP